ncbi:hypothetical protein BKP44_01280 [Formosa algae]|nr:hypothetical protein BKP44_01280 [Formosa algae]
MSQNIKISGQVLDQNNMPISYANVILVHTEDESIIKGTITDDFGKFEIGYLNSGTYNLEISFIGYSQYSTQIDLKASTILEPILLEEFSEALDAVNIFAKRPTYKKSVRSNCF